jgi:hypothetical protein
MSDSSAALPNPASELSPFAIAVDRVQYVREEGDVYCVPLSFADLVAPRDLICVSGRLFAVRAMQSGSPTEIDVIQRHPWRSILSSSTSVCLRSSLQTLCQACFSGFEHFSIVTFEFGSNLSRIERLSEKWTPLHSQSVFAISIPSSVEGLCNYCFEGAAQLTTVAFESGSKLSRIESHAFSGCSSLSSICIPSSVEVLGDHCLGDGALQ